MLKLLHHTDIDIVQWDYVVANSPSRRIYAFSWYLDLFCQDWSGLVLESNNKYTMVMPVVYKRKFGIFNILYQPYFCQQLGVFSLEKELNLIPILDFLNSKFFKIDYQFNSLNANSYFKLRPNYVLDMNRPYSDIEKKFKNTRKQELKKAQKLNYQIDTNPILTNVFENFYSQKKNVLIGSITPAHFEILKKAIEYLIPLGKAKVYAIFEKDKISSCAMILLDENKRAYLIFNYSDDFARKNYLNPLLISQFIKEYAEKIEFLDFEGSSIEGVAKYYQSFGAMQENYPIYQKINLFSLCFSFKY